METFDKAIQGFREIVGETQVIIDEADVERRGRCLIPRVKKASAFVYPSDKDQLQRIVDIARDHRLSLWPCATGRNWGYGSASPAQEGTVVVVLERMNRIIEVNETLAYAVVEPGVTYRQLHTYLRERNIKLWLDCTDGPADGSVMGNALERGIGETPYGDHFEKICGMEVLLADGRTFRTGGGPRSGYKTWNTFKWGVGPYLEGLFSQSNFGIVTQIGMWLMPEPEHFESCLFELKREEDFPALIDAMRELSFEGVIQSKVHLVNDVTTFGIVADDPRELLEGALCLSDERRAELRKEFNIAPWTFGAGLYGTKAQVRLARARIQEKLGRYGRLWFLNERLCGFLSWAAHHLRSLGSRPGGRAIAHWLSMTFFRKPLPCVQALPHMHAIEKGHPSDYFVKHAYMKRRGLKPADTDINPARDHCGGIWAGIIVSLEGKEVQKVVDHCRDLAARKRLDINFALMLASPRSIIVLTSLFYDKQDKEETSRVLDLYTDIALSTQAQGYQQYRTSTEFMDRIFATAPEFKDVAQQLKTALDPNNTLAPGKYGIDPIPPEK